MCSCLVKVVQEPSLINVVINYLFTLSLFISSLFIYRVSQLNCLEAWVAEIAPQSDFGSQQKGLITAVVISSQLQHK